MKLDSTDDSLSFSCIRLFRLVGGAPAQYAGFGWSIQIFVRWHWERRQLNMEGSRRRCQQFKILLLYRHCDFEARPCARPVDEVEGGRCACT
jgi:hypothetical protein